MSSTHSIPSAAGAGRDVYQIVDVADKVTLSLRTTRFYAEAGLLPPVGEDGAGAPLYDDAAVDRLLLVKKMKPLGFALDEMRALINLRDEATSADTSPERRTELLDRLQTWVTLGEEKLRSLEEQVRIAESFLHGLHDDAHRARRAAEE
ncbi:MerR family transcriptional regulator [Frankia sp. CNm7]|uniref:MerR family transcriptional regulator n=1 Tax=Frankia nepalensis TaxID=1836974 RepID=A0A937UQM8_9ACTN|nr:MerR family transcriptional regulator [Frankia nepalensis]MBL7497711.1 MerR family transcriptional regulator [Frankia nepalensis]MBL7514297.1 MerR family transcriptional regulator [Frankia nepalensis]MBL7523299.1 MerR family transcriptional regulator [Frankia nepalensis]MBL7630253.1 MerR family transcriptional regulator [Frankia nepalensis]